MNNAVSLTNPIPLLFIPPFLISIVFNVLYSLILLPIPNFVISQVPKNLKGSVQGEHISATALARAVGSLLGGIVMATYSYKVGFILVSLIALLTSPILSKFDLSKHD